MKFLKSDKFWWICLAVGLALVIAAAIVLYVQVEAGVVKTELVGTIHISVLTLFFTQAPIYLYLPGIFLTLAAAVGLAVKKADAIRESLTTSNVAMALSAVSGLGMVCAMQCMVIAVFGGISAYPIRGPASMVLGGICLLVFFALLVVYMDLRSQRWSLKECLKDIGKSILYMPLFFFGFAIIAEILG